MLCPIPICFNIDTTVIAFLSLYIDPLLCVALYLSLTKDQYPLFLLFHSCIIWIKRWIIDSHLIYHNRQFSPVMSISIHIPMFHIRYMFPFCHYHYSDLKNCICSVVSCFFLPEIRQLLQSKDILSSSEQVFY